MDKVAANGPISRVPSSLSHRWRLVGIAGLVSAFVFAAALALLLVFWPFREAKVAQALEETFAGEITVGHYRSTLFPHPGGIAEDVALHRTASFQDRTPLAYIKKLTIKANYWDLLLRPGYISQLLLDGFRVHVPARGSTSPSAQTGSAPGPVTRVGEVLASDAVLEIVRERGEPLVFHIHALRLTSVSDGHPFDFQVALDIPLPPGEVHASGQFGAFNSQSLSDTPASGKYLYENADLSVFPGIAGTLWSEGAFDGTLGQLQARGKVEIPDFEVKRSRHTVPVRSQYQAVVNATNGNVELQKVDSLVVQTRVFADGSVARKPGHRGKTTSLELTVSNGRIQDVLRVFVKARRPPLEGITSFQAHITIPPGDAPFLERVQLVGDFGVNKGEFTRQDTQQDIIKLSETGGGKKPENGEDPDPDKVVSALAGHVDLSGGTATFSNFSFSVPDAEANMHGTYNLVSEKVDLHGILRTTVKFSNTTSGFKSVLLKPFDAVFKRKHHSGAKVPVQLTGTYNHPHAGLEIMK